MFFSQTIDPRLKECKLSATCASDSSHAQVIENKNEFIQQQESTFVSITFSDMNCYNNVKLIGLHCMFGSLICF